MSKLDEAVQHTSGYFQTGELKGAYMTDEEFQRRLEEVVAQRVERRPVVPPRRWRGLLK